MWRLSSIRGRDSCGWAWQKHMKGEEMVRIWGAWAEGPGIDGWVWDGAGGHRSTDMQAVDAPRVVQPPYAPELNPVARFFRELRQALEGRVYLTLQAKQEALEPILKAWQADPQRVRQLCGWDWIRKALTALTAEARPLVSGGITMCLRRYRTGAGPRWLHSRLWYRRPPTRRKLRTGRFRESGLIRRRTGHSPCARIRRHGARSFAPWATTIPTIPTTPNTSTVPTGRMIPGMWPKACAA